MSSRLERWRETWEEDSPTELLADWYQVPALLLLMGFMLWTRLRSYENYVIDGEIFFGGNDPYYHLREVSYTVRNWPWTMPFDPWTEFPYGTSVDQFGTLFDQIVATAALVVGLGDPSQQTVATTLLVAPAVFGALVAIPVYFLGKRLGGRPGGVLAVALLALLPGSFFQRSLVGFSDHHAAEVLFQATAVLLTVIAVALAEREKPVYEQFLDRDWDGLRAPLLWSTLAGVATGLYVWVWPPAVVLVGILGVFYLVALSVETARGRSPEHLAVVGVTSLVVTLVVTAASLDTTTEMSVTSISAVHLVLIGAVAAGCAFMAALARVWEERDLDGRYYPLAIGTLVVVGTALFSVVLPDVFGTVVRNALRSFGFGQTDTTLTIVEAQAVPFGQLGNFLLREYGLLFVTAVVGLVLLAVDYYRADRPRSELLLLVVWGVFTTAMAMTQVRFNYYLAVVVAVVSVRAFVAVVPLLGLPERVDRVTDVKGYQVMAVLAVALLVLVPLMPPVAATDVVTGGNNVGPGSSVQVWDQSLEWMDANTPAEGSYGDADQPMPYYGTFERTDDFDYPAGAYGVMSWWDYGHWITVEGQRIPVANPFQHNARPASAFLQAASEERANLMLEALPSTSSPYTRSNDELRSIIANQSPQEAQEDTRYVMIDGQMAGGKFHAIATWAGPASGPNATFNQVYRSRQEVSIGNGSAMLVGMSQRYEDTMLARLYFRNAGGLSHYRLVHESDQQTTFASVAQRTQGGWQTVAVHRQVSTPLFRAVQSRPDLQFYDVRQSARVKTFERVEGATLTGTVPNAGNETPVYAILRLQTGAGRNTTYIQQTQTAPDGSFEMTVPYATDDGVSTADGGTNSSVTALGNYTIQAGSPFAGGASGTTAVPEEAVYEGREIQVELQQSQQGNSSDGSGNTSAGSGGQSGADGGTSGSDSQSSGGGNQSDGAGNESAGSVTVAEPIAPPEP